jgi:hypothetical protein
MPTNAFATGSARHSQQVCNSLTTTAFLGKAVLYRFTTAFAAGAAFLTGCFLNCFHSWLWLPFFLQRDGCFLLMPLFFAGLATASFLLSQQFLYGHN